MNMEHAKATARPIDYAGLPNQSDASANNSGHTGVGEKTGGRRKRTAERKYNPAIIVSVVALLVLVTALAHVGQRAQVAVLTYELQKEQLRLDQYERVHNHLMVEISKARSLAEIDLDARMRLGMVEPETVQWVTMSDQGASTRVGMVPGDATQGSSAIIDAISSWYHRVRNELGEAL